MRRRASSCEIVRAAVLFILFGLGIAYAQLRQFDDAWRCIGEAIAAVETTKERWSKPRPTRRVAGEIALKSPAPDVAKAQAYFERALAVARQQQAKIWELRAAMSMARLWRDQGKRAEARELLAPVYGWFTEGFDTRDLKEARRCSMSWQREVVVNREFQKVTLPATRPCVGSRDRCMLQESIWCELRGEATGLGFPATLSIFSASSR
jgi:hypothetical protein